MLRQVEPRGSDCGQVHAVDSPAASSNVSRSRARSGQPQPLMLFDEITSALDPRAGRRGDQRSRKARHRRRTTMILRDSCRWGFARVAADTVVFMHRGPKIWERVTPSRLFTAPATAELASVHRRDTAGGVGVTARRSMIPNSSHWSPYLIRRPGPKIAVQKFFDARPESRPPSLSVRQPWPFLELDPPTGRPCLSARRRVAELSVPCFDHGTRASTPPYASSSGRRTLAACSTARRFLEADGWRRQTDFTRSNTGMP